MKLNILILISVLLNTTPTRVFDFTMTILDHILINKNRFSLLPFVIDHLIPNHFLVVVSVLCNFPSPHIQLKYIRSFTTFSVKDFKTDLCLSFENFFYLCSSLPPPDLNIPEDQFYVILTQTINKHAPINKLTRRKQCL